MTSTTENVSEERHPAPGQGADSGPGLAQQLPVCGERLDDFLPRRAVSLEACLTGSMLVAVGLEHGHDSFAQRAAATETRDRQHSSQRRSKVGPPGTWKVGMIWSMPIFR